jgi:polyisoprenoid-binding protein YceI
MRYISRSSLLACACVLAACSQSAPPALDGDWVLDAGQSRLAFTSVKAGSIAEAHSFNSLKGAVSADGTATLSIDLASVETNIDVRNERVRNMLFETGMFPTADVTVQLDPAHFETLGVGETLIEPVEGELDLHGSQSTIATELAVTRIAENRVKVETTAPIIVDADVYGLVGGIAALQDIAGLSGITPQVPVSFSITYERAE